MTRCLLVAVLLCLPFLVACGESPQSEGEGETRYILAVIPKGTTPRILDRVFMQEP